MRVLDVLKKIVPEEVVYFIRKRIQRKDYGFKIFNRQTSSVYDEDCLFTVGKSLDFLKEPKFDRAYQEAVQQQLYVSPWIRWRLHVLCWAASVAFQLDGDFVECGVNKGFCSKIIMDYLDFNDSGKKILFVRYF